MVKVRAFKNKTLERGRLQVRGSKYGPTSVNSGIFLFVLAYKRSSDLYWILEYGKIVKLPRVHRVIILITIISYYFLYMFFYLVLIFLDIRPRICLH